MSNIVANVIGPTEILSPTDIGPFDLFRYNKRCLAQGDSWFSIGHLPPWATTNLLYQMVYDESCVIVDCAHPGTELSHMTDTMSQQDFLRLLRGKLAYQWHAIFLSGGGNDLIDAAQSPPTALRKERLLLRRDEWSTATPDASRYLCPEGWTTLDDHMNLVFDLFLKERDKGINAATPVFCHTYSYATPRNAPAGILGPWLYKAMKLYEIPEPDWTAVGRALQLQLRDLIMKTAARHAADKFFAIDTLDILSPAVAGTNGPSNDWENEIHPSSHGYSKLAQAWRPIVEANW